MLSCQEDLQDKCVELGAEGGIVIGADLMGRMASSYIVGILYKKERERLCKCWDIYSGNNGIFIEMFR